MSCDLVGMGLNKPAAHLALLSLKQHAQEKQIFALVSHSSLFSRIVDMNKMSRKDNKRCVKQSVYNKALTVGLLE